MSRLIPFLVLLFACNSERTEPLEHPCESFELEGDELDACFEGCEAAQVSAAYDWGRLACILDDEPLTPATFDVADQGEGRGHQLGYEVCFFDQVAEGYADEGC